MKKVMALSTFAALAALASGQATASAACPNEAIRASQASEAAPLGSTYLPACMAFEMVSPPGHFGQETSEISAFSPDGTKARFRSKAALADTPGLQAFAGDTYVATRSVAGWDSSPTSAPSSAQITGGIDPLQGGPFALASNLGSWTLFGTTQAQRFAGEGQFFTGALDGSFRPLSPVLTAINNETSNSAPISVFGSQLRPQATAVDLTATVFPTPAGRTNTAYLPLDPRDNAAANSYVAFIDSAGEQQVQLLARDDAGKVWGGRCGARVGGGSVQGAISPSGDRIFLTTRPAQPSLSPVEEAEGKYPPCSDTSEATNPQRILVRDQGSAGHQAQIAPLISGGPAAGSDTFQAASADGQMVYLTTSRKLVAGDEDSTSDLYLYDFSRPEVDRLVQVSAGEDVGSEHEVGKEANVASLVALSTDGSHVYFTAKGVLTEHANPIGEHPVKNQENLYLYNTETGVVSFVGILGAGENLSAQAVPMLKEPGSTAEGGNGHILALLSKAQLVPAEDNDSGRVDAYRYDADADTLNCLSCVAPFPDSAPFDISAGSGAGAATTMTRQGLPNFAEQGRWVSEDGQTTAFATAEPLEAGDEDGSVNPYLRVGGQIARLPGVVLGEVQMPTVSSGGEEVGFTTTQALLPQDPDTARDAYLVRSLGGFPNPVPPVSCNPLAQGSCEGAGSSASGAPPAASEAFRGPGNAKQRPPCAKGKHRNKKGRCVARKKHRKHHAKHRKSDHRKAAKRNRGGNR